MSEIGPARGKHQVLVRDAAGRPVAGAIVEVSHGTAPVPEVGRVTDSEGRLSLHLPMGRFRLRALTATGESGETDADGASDVIIEIEVRKP